MLRLPLADEVLLLGHNHRSGKLIVHGAILDVVLAAALIAELVMAGRAYVIDGRLFVTNGQPMNDVALDPLLIDIGRLADSHALGEWISLLRPRARSLVLLRLSDSGLVTLVKRRGSRGPIRVRPVDELATLGPWLRLRHVINTREPATADAPTAALAALAHALRVDQTPPALDLAVSRRQVRDWMSGAVAVLPPDLKAIVTAAASVAEGMIMLRPSLPAGPIASRSR